MLLACDILRGADLRAVGALAVPPEVVVADLDVVLLRHLLVLVEAGLLEGVAALLVLRWLEHCLVLLVTRLCGDVIAPGNEDCKIGFRCMTTIPCFCSDAAAAAIYLLVVKNVRKCRIANQRQSIQLWQHNGPLLRFRTVLMPYSPHFLVVDGLLDLDDLVHADVSLGQVLWVAVVGQPPELQDRVAAAHVVVQVVLGRLGTAIRRGDQYCEG